MTGSGLIVLLVTVLSGIEQSSGIFFQGISFTSFHVLGLQFPVFPVFPFLSLLPHFGGGTGR